MHRTCWDHQRWFARINFVVGWLSGDNRQRCASSPFIRFRQGLTRSSRFLRLDKNSRRAAATWTTITENPENGSFVHHFPKVALLITASHVSQVRRSSRYWQFPVLTTPPTVPKRLSYLVIEYPQLVAKFLASVQIKQLTKVGLQLFRLSDCLPKYTEWLVSLTACGSGQHALTIMVPI